MADMSEENPLTQRLEAALAEASSRHPEPGRRRETPAPPRFSTSTMLPKIDAPLIGKDEPSDSTRGIVAPTELAADLADSTMAFRVDEPPAPAAAALDDTQFVEAIHLVDDTDIVALPPGPIHAPVVLPPLPELAEVPRDSWRDRLKRPAKDPQLDAELISASSVSAPTVSASTAEVAAGPRSGGGSRQARVRVKSVDPWSVMKTAFLLSIALAIVGTMAVAIIWSMLGVTGIWDAINTAVRTVLDGEKQSTFDVRDYVGTTRIVGLTALVSLLNVFLLTALATLGAFLYNMAASLLGGVEVVLSEDR